MHKKHMGANKEWPDFSQTAGENVRCYDSRRSPWIELSVPGTSHIELLMKSPDWFLRGQNPCKSGDANLRPAVAGPCE